MKCSSIEINELAAAQGGAPIYKGHRGEGDTRLTLWALPKSGEELIETNGEPVGESTDGFAEMRALICGEGYTDKQ